MPRPGVSHSAWRLEVLAPAVPPAGPRARPARPRWALPWPRHPSAQKLVRVSTTPTLVRGPGTSKPPRALARGGSWVTSVRRRRGGSPGAAGCGRGRRRTRSASGPSWWAITASRSSTSVREVYDDSERSRSRYDARTRRRSRSSSRTVASSWRGRERGRGGCCAVFMTQVSARATHTSNDQNAVIHALASCVWTPRHCAGSSRWRTARRSPRSPSSTWSASPESLARWPASSARWAPSSCNVTGRLLRTTRAGAEFKRHVDALLHALDDGHAAVNELVDPETGTVDVAFQVSLGGWLVPGLIGDFRDDHPRVRFRLEQSDDALGSSRVAGGRSTSSSPPADRATRRCTGSTSSAQPLGLRFPDTPARRAPRVALADVADEDFVMLHPSWALRTLTDELCDAAGFSPGGLRVRRPLGGPRGFVLAGSASRSSRRRSPDAVPAAPGRSR